jgi:hypothetical protein
MAPVSKKFYQIKYSNLKNAKKSTRGSQKVPGIVV